MVPLTLTVAEFAQIVRLSTKTILRKIAAREIESFGRYHRIPRRELAKFGVEFAEVQGVIAK
jgi:excisionase family DNA binding protein